MNSCLSGENWIDVFRAFVFIMIQDSKIAHKLEAASIRSSSDVH